MVRDQPLDHAFTYVEPLRDLARGLARELQVMARLGIFSDESYSELRFDIEKDLDALVEIRLTFKTNERFTNSVLRDIEAHKG